MCRETASASPLSCLEDHIARLGILDRGGASRQPAALHIVKCTSISFIRTVFRALLCWRSFEDARVACQDASEVSPSRNTFQCLMRHPDVRHPTLSSPRPTKVSSRLHVSDFTPTHADLPPAPDPAALASRATSLGTSWILPACRSEEVTDRTASRRNESVTIHHSLTVNGCCGETFKRIGEGEQELCSDSPDANAWRALNRYRKSSASPISRPTSGAI